MKTILSILFAILAFVSYQAFAIDDVQLGYFSSGLCAWLLGLVIRFRKSIFG